MIARGPDEIVVDRQGNDVGMAGASLGSDAKRAALPPRRHDLERADRGVYVCGDTAPPKSPWRFEPVLPRGSRACLRS